MNGVKIPSIVTAGSLFLMILSSSMITSCGDTPSSADGVSTSGNSESSEQVTSPYLDHLGEYDFNGETFTVLCRDVESSDTFDEVSVEKETGDIVNDAVYQRNAEISERFNIVIDDYKVSGNWPDRDKFNGTLKNSVLSGEGAFDLVLGYQAYSCNLDVAECLFNFNDMPILNLDADYYYQDIIDEITLNDKLYYLVGDYTYSVWPSLFVYYFNKEIAENNHVTDLYELVRNGEWTIDKLMELSTDVYQDLNGDAKKDENDLFGLVTDYGNVADAYYSAFQLDITTRDTPDSMPAINSDIAKMESVVSKLSNFYSTSNGVYTFLTNSSMTTNPLTDIFVSNRALFYPERLKYAIDFRDLEADFGILPYPKWDEGQDKYYSQPWNGYSVMMVPLDVSDIDRTSVMIEALNAESLQTVIPAFYDKALKLKFTRDDDSGEMLEIIRDGISFQFGYFYTVTINSGAEAWRMRNILASNGNVASTFASCEKVMEGKLTSIVDFYTK